MKAADKDALADNALFEADDVGLCQANVTTTLGRWVLKFQLAGLPLLPSIALFIYSLVSLASTGMKLASVTDHIAMLESTTGALTLVGCLEEEASAVTLYVANNGTGSGFTAVESAYSLTNNAIDQITNWPYAASFPHANGASLKSWLYERRSPINARESSVQEELQIYTRVIQPITSWIEQQLKRTTIPTVIRSISAYRHLLLATRTFTIERLVGTVYYAVGQLSRWEIVEFMRSLALTRQAVFAANSANGPLLATKVEAWLMGTSNSLSEMEGEIRQNEWRSSTGMDSQLWSTSTGVYVADLKGMLETVHDDIMTALSSARSSAISLCVWYLICMMIILVLVGPFLYINTAHIVRNLHIYANVMENKGLELRKEKRKTEGLLNQMLPKSVSYRLKKGEDVGAESFEAATVLFSDIVEFTEISSTSSPIQIVVFLNDLYNFIDARIERFDCYKVETIGCVYMVVSGLPSRNGNRHASEIAYLALDLMETTSTFSIPHMPDRTISLRIGAHTGPCVAGVVGNKAPRYCLFGDTINTASRMQSNGAARRIHISEPMNAALVKIGGFIIEDRGKIMIKGKGEMNSYWLLTFPDAPSTNASTTLPYLSDSDPERLSLYTSQEDAHDITHAIEADVGHSSFCSDSNDFNIYTQVEAQRKITQSNMRVSIGTQTSFEE